MFTTLQLSGRGHSRNKKKLYLSVSTFTKPPFTIKSAAAGREGGSSINDRQSHKSHVQVIFEVLIIDGRATVPVGSGTPDGKQQFSGNLFGGTDS